MALSNYRHVIHATAHLWQMRHDFQGTADEMDRALEPFRLGAQRFAPWVFEELRRIAESSLGGCVPELQYDDPQVRVRSSMTGAHPPRDLRGRAGRD